MDNKKLKKDTNITKGKNKQNRYCIFKFLPNPFDIDFDLVIMYLFFYMLKTCICSWKGRFIEFSNNLNKWKRMRVTQMTINFYAF